METRESTTALCLHFGYIDGKFYQLQLLRRKKERKKERKAKGHLVMLVSGHFYQQNAEKFPLPETSKMGRKA